MLTVMRKAISIIMLLAAVATAFISCNKQTPDVKPSLEDQMLVFTSERPSFSDDVKTHWEEAENAVYWSKGDKIRMAYTINGVWQGGKGSMEIAEEAKLYESVSLDASTSIASFAVPIASTKFNKVDGEVKETGAHVFYSIYPSGCSNVNFDSEGVAQITVSTEQSPSDVTFDSKSDVMIGESVGDFDCIEEDVVIPLKWSRLVAHAKITLKSLKEAVEGETINSIVLTAQDGADMTGTYTVDLMTGVVSTKSGNNVLSIAGASLSAVDASKNVSFWACMMPCTWKSVKVVVDTDKAIYTRQINLTELGKEKTFLQNRRNLLTINMSTADREPKGAPTAYYEKVTSAPADWSGTYLIVCEGANIAMNGSLTSLSVAENYGSVTINEGKIEQSAVLDTYVFSITVDDPDAGTYKLQSSSGYYIGCKTTSFNAAKSYKSNTHANTITYDNEKSCVNIRGLGEYLLQYNSASNSNRFNYFSTEKNAIQLYKRSEDL